MSDKHTAAQGELVKAAEQFERFFALTDKLDVAYIADSLRTTAGVPTKHDGFDPDRATEGQAQTSAACNFSEINSQTCARGTRGCSIQHVAQLADSTVPGAKKLDWQQLKAKWDSIKEWEVHAAMGLREDISWKAFAGCINEAIAALTAQQSRHDRSPYIFGAKPPLSIAAQQSLTAGGAVPEGYMVSDSTHVCGIYRKREDAQLMLSWSSAYKLTPLFAAAPLPQVQSEALDANDICQLPPTDWYCTRKAGHAGPCAAHQHEPDRELDSDDHAAIAKGMARIRADQQPVTPSGAQGEDSARLDAQVTAAARVLANRSADQCGVNRDDNWKLYGQDFIDDARAALAAARASAETGGVK